MKEKIIMAAAREINQRGIKFTIDRIAACLGISKKTVYQYFPSKDALISEAVEAVLAEIEEQEQEILADTKGDFAERVKELLLLTPKKYGKADDWVIEQFKRSRPQDWKRIEEFTYERMLVLSEFLEKGIASGIVRNINTKVASRILLSACREMTQYDYLVENHLDSIQVRKLLTDIFLYGILEKNISIRNDVQ